MSDATKLELVKNLPAIITALFAGIAALLVVVIRKIDHVKELTNNSYSEAKDEIKGLKETLTTSAATRLRELEDEVLRLKAERTTVITSTSTPANGPIPVKVENPPHEPANVKISEEAVKSAVEAVKEEGG